MLESSSDLLHICSNKPKCDDYRTDDGCLKKWCKGMGFDHQQCKAVSLKCGWLSQEDLDYPQNPAPPAYVSHSGRNVWPGMGNQTGQTRRIATNSQIGKGAFFFQKPVIDATSTVPAVPVVRGERMLGDFHTPRKRGKNNGVRFWNVLC